MKNKFFIGITLITICMMIINIIFIAKFIELIQVI